MLARLGRGFAALAIALGTVIGVVAFPSTAQALHNGTFSQQELKLVQGGVKAAAPRVAARAAVAGAVCGGTLGVGCVALAVLGLGLAAYETREFWLPWVKGNLGEGTDPTIAGQAGTYGYANWQSPATIGNVATSSTGIGLNVLGTWNAALGGTSAVMRTDVTCRRPDGSTFTQAGTRQWSRPNAGTPVPVTVAYHTNPPSGGWCLGTGNTVQYAKFSTPELGILEYQAAQPVTSVETELICQTPAGGTYSVKVVTESPTDQVKVGHCAEGDTPLRVKTVPTVGGTATPQWDVPLAPWDATSDQEYPLCAGGACTYRIHVDGNPCVAGVEACTHWSYIYREQPTRVECFYGPYSLNVANNCMFLERAYDLATGARTVTSANTDGNPDTYTAPAPLPARSPTASPTPTPTSTSTGSASPTPTPTPTPDPIGQPVPNPPADPAGSRCFPSGWGLFNPFEWVYKPVVCAMRDAFVPNKDLTVSRLDSLRGQVATAGPGPAIAQVSSLLTPAGSAAGCAGPAVTFSLSGVTETMRPFSACAEPMSTAAGYVKALATVSITIGGALAIIRALGAGFGFSFSMGRGGNDGE